MSSGKRVRRKTQRVSQSTARLSSKELEKLRPKWGEAEVPENYAVVQDELLRRIDVDDVLEPETLAIGVSAWEALEPMTFAAIEGWPPF